MAAAENIANQILPYSLMHQLENTSHTVNASVDLIPFRNALDTPVITFDLERVYISLTVLADIFDQLVSHLLQ